VVVLQANEFNASRIQTVIVATVTSNLRLAEAPGNVLVSKRASGLKRDSVVNVSQLLTLNKTALTEKAGRLEPKKLASVEGGLRLVLSLS
jgi:mRNA interferase MazF